MSFIWKGFPCYLAGNSIMRFYARLTVKYQHANDQETFPPAITDPGPDAGLWRVGRAARTAGSSTRKTAPPCWPLAKYLATVLLNDTVADAEAEPSSLA